MLVGRLILDHLLNLAPRLICCDALRLHAELLMKVGLHHGVVCRVIQDGGPLVRCHLLRIQFCAFADAEGRAPRKLLLLLVGAADCGESSIGHTVAV